MAVVVLLLIWAMIFRTQGADKDSIPHGTPPVIVVTPIEEEGYSPAYIENIKQNRIEYAKRHGYAVFLPKVEDYQLSGAPSSWAKVPAIRHAMSSHPHIEYVFYLDQNSLIMNPSLIVEEHIMAPARMESLMLKDKPIVPPDSVIKTYTHLKGTDVDFAITQGPQGLIPGAFVLRRGEWSKFFLDTWFDPLYRSYNFQKADTHALEHIVQWHPTILSRMAIVPQRIMNAFVKSDTTNDESAYKDGDFVVRFPDCHAEDKKNCETLSLPFSQEWQTIFHAQR